MNRIFYTLCFIIFLVFSINAQNAVIDSLEKELLQADQDTLRVLLLNQLFEKKHSFSLEESLEDAKKAIEIAKQVNYLPGLGRAYFNEGFALLELGDTDSALKSGSEGEKIFQDLRDTSSLTRINNLLGIAHLRIGQTEMAIEKLFTAAKYSEEAGDWSTACTSYNNMGEIYVYSNDAENAFKYYQKALEFTGKTQNMYHRSMILINMANTADSLDQKLSYLEESISIAEENQFSKSLSYAYPALGDIQLTSTREYEKAIGNYRKGLKNSKTSGDFRMMAHNLIYMSATWLELNEADSASFYLDQVDGEGLEENHLRDYVYYKAQALHEQGMNKEAFMLIDSSLSMHTRHFDESLAEKTADANTKFETEKKEAEIARQELEIHKKTNSRNIIAGGSILVFALLGSLFFGITQRNKRKRRESELALQMEQERVRNLEELTEMKTTLFNNISHELRTPLSMIIAPLSDAADKVQNIHIKQDIELALKNSRRMLNMTNEILDLSKIDASKLKLELETGEIFSFLSRSFRAFESLAKSRDIMLRDNIPSDRNIYITSDFGKLETILTNLISNAIKFSYKGTLVSLDLNAKELEFNMLELSISDQGPGIPEHEKDLIFDRYYQSDDKISTTGTGIGLALVKELVQLLDGHVFFKSNISSGTTFTIKLPVQSKESPAPEEQSDIAAERNFPPILINGQKPALLIVEDNPEMSDYLLRLLNKDYDCDQAFDGKEALRKISSRSYDLITSDVMMPHMDGFEFREEFNRINSEKDTAFIMLTARALEEDKLKGFRLGIDDYITKPFSSSELLARIHNLLKNKIERISEDSVEESFDEAFIARAKQIVTDHIDDPGFKVEDLATSLNYSSRQLARILKKLTGLSPVNFILEIRLQEAYRLLRQNTYKTVKEVQYEIGIDSASYFSNKFKERFGVSPGNI